MSQPRTTVPGALAYNSNNIKSRSFEPQPNTKDGRRYFDQTINNPRRDQSVIYEVQVQRIRYDRPPKTTPKTDNKITTAEGSQVEAEAGTQAQMSKKDDETQFSYDLRSAMTAAQQ